MAAFGSGFATQTEISWSAASGAARSPAAVLGFDRRRFVERGRCDGDGGTTAGRHPMVSAGGRDGAPDLGSAGDAPCRLDGGQLEPGYRGGAVAVRRSGGDGRHAERLRSMRCSSPCCRPSPTRGCRCSSACIRSRSTSTRWSWRPFTDGSCHADRRRAANALRQRDQRHRANGRPGIRPSIRQQRINRIRVTRTCDLLGHGE